MASPGRARGAAAPMALQTGIEGHRRMSGETTMSRATSPGRRDARRNRGRPASYLEESDDAVQRPPERDAGRDEGSEGMIVLDHFGTTDVGRVRRNNEDALLAGGGEDPNLFAVADGMGGHKAGEVASFLAVATLKRLKPGHSLAGAIRKVDRTILACRDDGEFAGMGTTVVVARFREDGTGRLAAEVAHVGDSRAYLLRAGDLRRLTADHSLVADLVRSGAISPDRAAAHPLNNALTRSLGTGTAAVERATFEAWPGDRVVLCSDGLPDAVSETEIWATLRRYPGDPKSTARALTAAALEAGGPDNVTVVVVDLKGCAAEAPSPRREPSGRADGARAPRTRNRELLGALLPHL